MFNNEMPTHNDSMYTYVEVLALKSVSEIQIPVSNSLAVLTSTDCLKLIVGILLKLLYFENNFV